MGNLKMKTYGGDTFDEVALKAKAMATQKDAIVEFEFNGVKCLVDKDTDLRYLHRDYSNSWTMDWKTVGADCVAKYDAKTTKELKRRTKIKEEKRAEESRQYKIKEDKERAEFENEVAGIEIELTDVDGWNKFKEINSKDGYSKCVVDYAEGWAKLMQAEISKGKSVKDVAENTSHKLGFLGITGFMYGCAVSSLSKFWKHGEDLRKWHNKEYNHEGEGVVNPAVLTISTK